MKRVPPMAGNLIKSKDRVKAHGEVFTPAWMVDFMLQQDGIIESLSDPYSTFFEPAAGDGNFLVAILQQKLNYINATYSGITRDIKSLWALSSIYGIEILTDNLLDARENMLTTYMESYAASHKKPLRRQSAVYKSARLIIEKNIQQGNTLTCETENGHPIVLSHWWRVKGTSNNVERQLFTLSSLLLTQDSHFEQAPLFEFEDGHNPAVENSDRFHTGEDSMNINYEIVPIRQVYKELRK